MDKLEEQEDIVEQGQTAHKEKRARQSDDGPEILPGMEKFVALVRKVKQAALIVKLLERAGQTTVTPGLEKSRKATGLLAVSARRDLFQFVAELMPESQLRLEHAAERVLLLADEYGAQAVMSLLDAQNSFDVSILAAPTDRYSRALHLYLLQEFRDAGAGEERRFDHAERRQVMHRQWKSDEFSSHYLGPREVEPQISEEVRQLLRTRIAALFPAVSADQILIEHFTRHEFFKADESPDVDSQGAPVLLHTLSATFNGSTACFSQVEAGQVIDHEEPAATAARFSWIPQTGTLAVFCEDKATRRDLAIIFRDVVLACDGEISAMPIREFDLIGFCSPAMLDCIAMSRIDEVEAISILQIKVARPFLQHTVDQASGEDLTQKLSSTLLIGRDRRDGRNIYQLAYDDYGLDDLSGYVLSQVKLVFRMKKQPHRNAHNVSVQITSPNGLNDDGKTNEDRACVIKQLVRIGVLCEL